MEVQTVRVVEIVLEDETEKLFRSLELKRSYIRDITLFLLYCAGNKVLGVKFYNQTISRFASLSGIMPFVLSNRRIT
jgi:hypothetical protein